MLNFLRKLRRNNMNGKYLKYAIGEIFLVVIGILIALSINNWNEIRKNKNREQEILIQLESEYLINLEQLRSKMEIREIVKRSALRLLRYMNQPKSTDNDSILYYISRTGYRPTFDPIKNDIINSDQLQLIRDKTLKALLSQWETNVQQLNEEEWFWRDYVISVRLPFLMNQHIARKVYYKGSENERLYLLEEVEKKQLLFNDTDREIDFHQVLMTKELEAIAVTAVSSTDDANANSKVLEKNIIKIIELLKKNKRK